MFVLGIDPGLARTGWSIIDYSKDPKINNYGCITTSSKTPSDKRIVALHREIEQIIIKYQPRVCAIEKLFFNTNEKTALLIGEARGVIKLTIALHNIPIFEYTPLQIKNTICGYGRADKKQVQLMVKTLLNLSEIPKPDDTADAVAVGITYCFFNNNLVDLKR